MSFEPLERTTTAIVIELKQASYKDLSAIFNSLSRDAGELSNENPVVGKPLEREIVKAFAALEVLKRFDKYPATDPAIAELKKKSYEDIGNVFNTFSSGAATLSRDLSFFGDDIERQIVNGNEAIKMLKRYDSLSAPQI